MACTPRQEELAIDVQADRLRMSAADPEAITSQTTTLHANVSGGQPPYVIIWSVKDPMGQNRDDLLDNRHASDPVFHPGPLIGPYLLTCRVTDSLLRFVTDSAIIYVSQDLGISLSVDRQVVPNGGGSNGQSTITAEIWGGSPPYTYEWSVLGPDDVRCDDRLTGSANASRVFTSGSELGTYRITCTVKDATGAIASQTAQVVVNRLLSVNLSSNRPVVTPGGGLVGQALLVADVSGGSAPYTYSWSMFGPDGLKGDWLDDPTSKTPLFTSPAQTGTYRAVCTVVDDRGQEVVASMLILVDQQLSISVLTDRQRISAEGGSTGKASLSSIVVGGTPPYTHRWTVLDPMGQDAADLLDDFQCPSPVFTSNNLPGTYRLVCEVTDALGQVAVDSLVLVVGQQLSAEVTVSTAHGAQPGGIDPSSDWVTSGGGPNGQATITAEAIGGSPPYTYTWVVIDPNGELAPDRLTGSSPNTRVFQSSNVLGAYRVACTITDSTGMSASDSVKIVVHSLLSVTVTMDRVQIPANGGPDGTAHLFSNVTGGIAPFTYAWTLVAPDGEIDNSFLDDPTAANPTFTSGPMSGIYRASCVVTDAVGQQIEDALLFIVGQPVTLDVTCDRTDVIAGGGQAHLAADARGGIPPYQFVWSVRNPLGQIENERLDDIFIATPTFTSSLLTGTFTFTCTVTDAAGFVAVLSTSLVVGGGLDQGLSVDVSTTHPSLAAPGTQAGLTAVVLGGVPPVIYEWAVIGPGGELIDTALDDPTIPGPIFTAPGIGVYRIACTVTDSVLKRFTDSLIISVGMPLSLDALATKSSIPAAGGTASLLAVANGGTAPYSYAWTAIDPSGGDAVAALSATDVASPTFTAPAIPGTYRFTCTVTDAAGATFSDSVSITVGMGLSASITAVKQSLPSGQTTALNVTVNGGTSPYSYAWNVLDPAGDDATAALSATNVPDPTFTAPAGAGTYRLTCTVSDAAGASFPATLHLQVGMPLSLDVIATKSSLPAAGGTTSLLAIANGGTAPYSYAWTAVDPSGADAAATLSSVSVASPTFTAPATPGAYRFTCTVTDTAGATFSDSVSITVGMGLSASITAVKQSLPSGQTTALNVTVNGGTSPYSYAWSVLDPAGDDATTALSAADVPDPTFTAPANAGTYRLTCTVSDAAGASFPATLHLQVGMPLSLDVVATKSSLPAAGGTTSLLAIANGGTAPYSYAWTAVDPSGGDAATALSATNVASPTFTAPATAGTYRFTCTVTDAAGTTFSDSVSITVGMGLSASITAVRQSLPSGQTTALSVTVNGGVSPYTYAWSILDPANGDATAALSAVDVPDPTFTAPANAGTYRVTCTVSDAAGASFPATLHLQVGMPLSLDVVATKSSIPAAGGTATLLAIANGGTAPYSYAWTAIDPSGGNAVAALSATNVSSPTFTAPATPGTYRFTCTVTDAAGATFSDSVSITVGMGLSASISAVKQSLPSGQTTALNVTVNGGTSPYSYAWSVLDPAGDDATTALSAVDVPDPTFTAPANAGTYRLTCTVSDAAGASFPATLHLQVGMPLSLDVVATKSSLPAAGGTTSLLAIANGGTAPYSYAWTAVDPSGGDAATALSATNVASPTFTAPATAGTYRFTCTVTDAAGTTFSDSVSISVGMGLSASITAVRQSLPSGQTTALSVTVNGGVSPYTYTWSVLDPAGDDATAALSATNVSDPTFAAPAGAGTYRLTCTVSDAAGASFPATLHLQVGMPLSLDVVATKSSIPAAGGTASLLAIANGGTAPYSYAWTAVDPSGGDAVAALSATNVSSPTFTAPATPGAYRFTCTVTDAAGATFSDSVSITVGMGLSASITAVKQSLPSGQTTALNVTVNGGTSPYSYAWSVLDPAGDDATTALSAADVPDPTFTAPANAGTYRLTCTVSDAAGASFPATLHLQVGMPLSLDVIATKSSIPAAGGTASLLAIANGGTAPYSYVWTAVDPSGGNAVAALSATNVPSPTFTAPATPGAYCFTCTVTDTAGATFSDSVSITVGMGLSASITAVKQSLPSGQTTGLSVTVNGGTSPYSYAWSVLNPAGGDATAALSATNVPDPIFTAPASAGTYRVTCTVSDAAGASFPATLHLQVGMSLSLDVLATKSSIPAAGGTALLLAIANGGTAPYSYAWTAVDPSDADAAAALSATNVPSPTFTAPATAGTYRFTCMVTDTAGATFSDSVSITVGMGLSASIAAVKQSLPSGQTTALNVTVNGGVSPYTYAWNVLDPAGSDAASALSAVDEPDPTFTAPANAGTYRLTCTVSDAAGASFPATLHLQVGMPLSLDVVATKSSIPAAGGTASLLAIANGGTAPYSYAWTAVDPSGGNAVAALSATNVSSPTFTAPATPGTYRFICTVTDTVGVTFSDSVSITVGMGLSASITAVRQSLPSGQTTALSVTVNGGVSPYTYAWSILDPANGDATAALSAADAPDPIFTAPASTGTYRLTCTVSDAAGASFPATLHLQVGVPLSLDVIATKSSIPAAGGTASLLAVANGGTAPYSYAWAAVDPSGADAATTLSATNVPSPTFTAPAAAGTYRFTCAVTDAAGATFSDSVNIIVGMPLSAHAFASRISLSAGQTSTLSVGTVGGLAPFTYAWVVLDPGGNPISALNDPAASSPVFTAPATPGTYRITCTVTDAASATAVAVLHLNVEMPLSLVVVTDKDIMTATSTTYLAAIPTGGVPGYTYSWSVVNPALQDVTAATLSSDTAQYPLFTAPILGGTYKVFCTVTDAQNTTFTSAVHIFVATNMLELTAPAAADSDAAPNSILSRNFPGSTQNIVFEVDAAVKNLPHARNLKVRVFDGGSPSLNGVFYIAVDGVSADGHFQTEYFRFTGEGTVEGEMCFARVDMVRWVRTQNSSVPASNDGVMVGVGNTFGLPEILPSPASVRRVVRLPSTTLATPADYTVITTPGRQGVRFTNPAHVPNGSNSYQIFYDDN